MEVVQIEESGCRSSHVTTAVSGFARIRAESTSVSRIIIPRNPAPGAECHATREFLRLPLTQYCGNGRRSESRALCGLWIPFSWHRVVSRYLDLRYLHSFPTRCSSDLE